jgi:hypothetical protein
MLFGVASQLSQLHNFLCGKVTASPSVDENENESQAGHYGCQHEPRITGATYNKPSKAVRDKLAAYVNNCNDS